MSAPPSAGAARARSFGALVVVVVVAVPLWWLVVEALRPVGGAPPTSIVWWPGDPTFDNVRTAFEVVPLGRHIANSLLAAVFAVPIAVFVASWAGFAIARLGGRAAVVLIGICLSAAMVPAPSLVVGKIVLFRAAGLTETPVPLIAQGLVGLSPLLVLLYAWSFRRLPADVYDLARETGLSPPATWWKVAMPLVSTTTRAVAAIAFVLSWGDLIGPLFLVHDARWFTVPLGLRALATVPVTEQPVMLAGALVAMAPALVALAVLRRGLVEPRGRS